MSTVEGSAPRRLRADAERNRLRILEAAGTLFAERGLCVSLDEIAAAAGVGVGTVYRRYPDKDALVDALFADRVAGIERLARECLAIEDPWEAFATLVRGTARQYAEDRGLKEVLLAGGGPGERALDRVRLARETIAPIAGQVLQRAQDAGVVRDDLRTVDVPLLHLALSHVAERTSPVAPDHWERLCTIVLDGLAVRRETPTPLPAPELDEDQFAAAMTTRGAAGRTPA